ncbi:hypothetical protein EVA_13303 [gut metagenome]|uniref:Uncharacterized protein n=1 Tax=gut metagenome TaxID=749906 RepID=J9FUF7_9ZZZZ
MISFSEESTFPEIELEDCALLARHTQSMSRQMIFF